ncbi:MAG: hypothetical protein H0T56_05715 [Pseudaminobacter sp.]|nr:hypothetical protein [Pseudaminobacter sp.]
MLRQISEDVRVNLKDRLRDVRHVVRQGRHGRLPGIEASGREAFPPARIIEDLLAHAAGVVEDAMSMAQSLALVERFGDRRGAAAKSLVFYFGESGRSSPTGERAFRRDMYSLAKAVAAEKKIADALIYEADFAAVHASIRKRHAGLLAAIQAKAGTEDHVAAVAALCAALLIEFLDHHPIRFSEAGPFPAPGSRWLDRDLEIRCLAPIALACGLATVNVDDFPAAEMLEIAVLAADVRHDRIVQACGKADARGELRTVFATLLAHLP